MPEVKFWANGSRNLIKRFHIKVKWNDSNCTTQGNLEKKPQRIYTCLYYISHISYYFLINYF
jgi:hypothetical protein